MRVFVLDGNLAVGELGDAFEHLEWTRRLWQPHSVTLDLNLRQLHAASIEKGRLLYLPDEDDLAFLIEHIETNDEPGAGKDAMRVIGRSIDAIATEERLAQPPAGQAYDKQTAVAAETAMKHYVDENAGPGAAAARVIPNLAIATDLARGTVLSVSARYQLVGDILREIGYGAGMGWETAFDPTTGAFEFDVIPGVDRTASVFLDTAFDTLERYSELDTLIDTKTHLVVAGQGEGADREVVERFLGLEKTGLDRREAFIDARDVEMGDTGVLEQRGDSALEALQAQKRYEATAHPYGSFRYREHWDLGDLVTLRDADRGLETSVRIVTVTSRISDSKAAPEREVQLDRPFPTLKDRVGGSNPITGGAVDSGGSVPSGAIVLWSGSVASIPSGWALCNGANGTPDLRDRFVVGTDGAPGAAGTVSPAAALATHAGHSAHSDHASHQHQLPFGDNGTANLGRTLSTFGHSGTLSIDGVVAFTAAGGAVSALLTGGNAAQSHSAHSAHDAHGVYKHYKLAFIMKL